MPVVSTKITNLLSVNWTMFGKHGDRFGHVRYVSMHEPQGITRYAQHKMMGADGRFHSAA